MTNGVTAAQKPWLKSYPQGVPAEIDVVAQGTIIDNFRSSMKAFGPRPAFESFGKTILYRDLEVQADAFAAWLQARGMKKGDRVALMMPNVLAYPVTIFGTLLAGCTVVNVNPLYTPRELVHQLKDSGARMIVVLENFAHVVAEALTEAPLDQVIVATPGDLMGFKGHVVNFVSRRLKKAVPAWSIGSAVWLKDILAQSAGKRPEDRAVTQHDPAFLQYTGGTTGIAKGAVLTHGNIAANVAQCKSWLTEVLNNGDAGPQQVMVTALPLYHIFALTCCCMVMIRSGVKCLLVANPRDISGFIKLLASHPVTLMSGVNTLYNALANHPDIKKVDFSHLRFCVAGGMATQRAVAEKWKAITGKPIIEGYGLSETSPVVCINRVDIDEFSGTIGYPTPSTEIAIRDPQGEECPVGVAGELCVRGPQVMAGYWQRPDETAKAMTPDGFFRTGDVAVLQPDGAIKIVDRLKDMVLVSGFNVYPNEVEDVLARHPGVLEVAVIGLPDAHSGEAVTAYVVRKDPAVTEEELRDYCRENLTGYKVPKQVIFRDSLPKTNVGKVLRRMLREELSSSSV